MPTIKDTAEQYLGGEIDMDVRDTEISMAVCFSYDGDTSSAYGKFLEILYNNVNVSKYDPDEQMLVCDFSGFYRMYKDQLVDWVKDNVNRAGVFTSYIEYDMALATEGLVAGFFSDEQYASLNDILLNKG